MYERVFIFINEINVTEQYLLSSHQTSLILVHDRMR